MKTFAIAQGNVALLLGKPPIRDEAEERQLGVEKAEAAEIPRLVLEFSEHPDNSAECRLRVVAPNGAVCEALFHKNGAMLSSAYFDAEEAADRVPFETQADADMRANKAAEVERRKPQDPRRDPRDQRPGGPQPGGQNNGQQRSRLDDRRQQD